MKAEAVKAARAGRGRELPGGQPRMRSFPGQLRATQVTREDKNFYEVEGYATVFNKPYPMFDMFGEYTEQIAPTALDKSLANNPDVNFLLNHRGLAMARTVNGTLELSRDFNGLRTRAYLNATRSDVKDLASAIDDGIITEMSFAFTVGKDSYQWNDDFSALTLTEIDINRGDVSAVNYGANPYTSIAARCSEFLEVADRVPVELARAAFMRLSSRADITSAGNPAGEADEPEGASADLYERRYRDLTGQ